MGGVISPFVHDVENFCAQNAAEHDEDAEIPGLLAVVTQAFRVTDADPETNQYAQSYKEAVGRQKEAANMKELGKHCLFGCAKGWFRYRISLAGNTGWGAGAKTELAESRSRNCSRAKEQPTHQAV